MKLWFAMTACAAALAAHPVFNVKDYGATGLKQENARQALQQAIDACGRAGGSTVYVPPGEYTSGQLRLRSGVRLYVEAGATLFASLDGKEFYRGPGYDRRPSLLPVAAERFHRLLHSSQSASDGGHRNPPPMDLLAPFKVLAHLTSPTSPTCSPERGRLPSSPRAPWKRPSTISAKRFTASTSSPFRPPRDSLDYFIPFGSK